MDGWIVAVGAAALLVGALALVGAGALVVQRVMGGAPSGQPLPPDEPLPGADAPPADPDAEGVAAREAMRARYRPGPHVEVLGLLPTGLAGPAPLSRDPRGGRTIDNPWIVAGAELGSARALPAPATSGPSVEVSTRRLHVVPSTPVRLPVRATAGDAPVTDLLLRFDGYEGVFRLPATVETELGHFEIEGLDRAVVHFGVDAPLLPDGRVPALAQPFDVTLEVAALDREGRASAPMRVPLRVLPVGVGDVEVTLTMSESTDLDLYVVDPTGVAIYYGNASALSGGHLDLDANLACSDNMGVDNEHVFWERGRAPAGTYQVRVAHYRSCIGGRPVDYQVTVRSCGETAVLSGRMEGGGDERDCLHHPGPGERDTCQHVVTFDVAPCPGAIAGGMPPAGVKG